MVSKTNQIIFGSIIVLFFTISYNYLISPIHYARTTFVLDNENSAGSIGDLSSLASLAGINASSFIDASSLFQIDNIQELYRSNNMLKQGLLAMLVMLVSAVSALAQQSLFFSEYGEGGGNNKGV